MNVNAIIKQMSQRGYFPKLSRKPLDISMNECMSLIQAAGRQFCPSFVIDRNNEPAYKALAMWIIGRAFTGWSPDGKSAVEGDPCKGIYISGRTGTGKSLALKIVRAITAYCGEVIGISGNWQLLTWGNMRAIDITNSYAKEGMLDAYMSRNVLCIQDLGAEPREAIYMGNRVDALRLIIEARGDETTKMTLITSNIIMSEIGQRYGARVASRLQEMCNHIIMNGPDRRLR